MGLKKIVVKPKKLKYLNSKPSKAGKLRAEWEKKGFELVNITGLCTAKICDSGWCNNFNEPDESCYHVKINYRDECIASFDGKDFYVIDEDKYLLLIDLEDFVIFRKVKLNKRKD
jgi:hypothetical protein